MMHKSLSILIALFLHVLLSYANRSFAQSYDNFKGKLKTVKHFLYHPDGHVTARFTMQYDTVGREMASTFLLGTKRDFLVLENMYYDNKGRRIMKTTSARDKKKPATLDTLKITYTYNKQQNLVETYGYGKNAMSKTVYDKINQTDTFYRDGKPEPFKIIKHINTLQDEQTDFYRESINMSVGAINPNDTIPAAHRSVMIFDKNRNIVDERNYYADGRLFHHKISVYDENNNQISFTDSTWRDDNGTIEKKPKLFYSRRTFQYKAFDKAGNWTKAYEIINDKPVLTNRRKFKYYP
jgi:hypothetical protein